MFSVVNVVTFTIEIQYLMNFGIERKIFDDLFYLVVCNYCQKSKQSMYILQFLHTLCRITFMV